MNQTPVGACTCYCYKCLFKEWHPFVGDAQPCILLMRMLRSPKDSVPYTIGHWEFCIVERVYHTIFFTYTLSKHTYHLQSLKQPHKYMYSPCTEDLYISILSYPTSYIQHPTSSILHPASYILQPVSYIQHPTSYIQHPTPYIRHLFLQVNPNLSKKCKRLQFKDCICRTSCTLYPPLRLV